MSTDQEIEAELAQKGLNEPRVTANQIEAMMDSLTIKTHHFEGTTVTVAIATLSNGFVVAIDFSGSVSAGNFDPEIGIKVATTNVKKRARDKLWEFEGYLLRHVLDNKP
jgi:Phage protein (N4 Gp49/phage Sf6 gene 66) family